MPAWESQNIPAAARSAAGAAASLRPLSIGELFDRAFTVYLRNILTFSAILLVVIVPLVVLQYFISKDVLNAYFDLMQNAMAHPNAQPDFSKMAAAEGDPFAQLGLSMLYYLIAFATVPLANAAVVSGISRAYLGMPVRFADCYRHAMRRWLWVLVFVVLWGMVFGFSIFFLTMAALVVVLILAVIGQALGTAGVVSAVVVGAFLFLAIIALGVMGYMAYAASFTATVLENVDPLRGSLQGISRIFGGGQFWRSFAVACALLFLGLAFAIVAGAAGALVTVLTKAPVFYFLAASIAQVLFTAIAFAVVAVYYYDIRIRREGFDLQLLADQLAAGAPPTPSAPAP